jgi:ubiquinone/menaquinone biosynthesis C-methylase UbiE
MTPSSSSTSSGNERFKIDQHQRWNSVAAGWKEWWQTIEVAAQKVSDRMVELAEIKPNQKVLDIATGIGEPAVTAARKLVELSTSSDKISDNQKNTGHVLATDISPQMLTIAKQRATVLGLQYVIDFRQPDAEMLELPNSSFDVVLCRWGLMFMSNLNNALSRIHQVLVPGGRLACAVWAEASKVPFISFPMSIVMRELNVPALPSGTPSPFALADISILQDALSSARFTDIKSERLNVTFEFAKVEDYINYTKAVGSTIKTMLGKESVKRQEEVWNIVTKQVKNNYSDVDHSTHIRIDNESICVIAKRR